MSSPELMQAILRLAQEWELEASTWAIAQGMAMDAHDMAGVAEAEIKISSLRTCADALRAVALDAICNEEPVPVKRLAAREIEFSRN